MQVLEAALEALQIQEKRKLLKNDPSSIKSAVKAIKKDTLDDAFLKEAKKGKGSTLFKQILLYFRYGCG